MDSQDYDSEEFEYGFRDDEESQVSTANKPTM
jgi:hypothetical protein